MTEEHPPVSAPSSGLLRKLLGYFPSFSPYEWVIACTVLLFCIQFVFLPRQTFFSPDEGMRLIASRSLRTDSLLTSLIHYQGQWLDPQIQFTPYYSAWFSVLPGPELLLNYSHILYGALLAPFVALGGVAGAQVLSILCSALMGLCTAGILQRIAGRGIAVLGVICLMLILPSALYAFLVWEHTLTLALFLLAVWCFLAWQSKPRVALLILGAGSLLIACVLRIEMAFVIAPVLIWAFGRWPHQTRNQRIRIWSVTALMLIAMGIIYGWLTTYTPQRLPRLTLNFDALWLQRADKAVRYFLAGYGATDATLIGLLVILVIGSLALWIFRQRPTVTITLATSIVLLASMLDALSLLNIPPFGVSNPGLLGSAPVLLAAILVPGGMRDPLRFLRRGFLTVIAGYLVGTVFFSSLAFRAASVMSQTSSTWADRYFLVLYPLAGLVALQTIHGWLGLPARRWSKVLLGIAVGVSFGAGIMGNLMGVSRIADDKQLVAAACQPIWQSDAQVVITDDWWRAEECAADARQTYLLVTDPKLLPALNQTLWRSDIDQFIFASRDGILPLQTFQDSLSQCYKFKVVDNTNDQFGMFFAKVVLEKHQTECP